MTPRTSFNEIPPPPLHFSRRAAIWVIVSDPPVQEDRRWRGADVGQATDGRRGNVSVHGRERGWQASLPGHEGGRAL